MKKRVFSMLMVVMLLCSMLSVTGYAVCESGCVDLDENCVCDTCSDPLEHGWIDNGTKAICEVCGEVHTHALTWVNSDADNHWQVCSGCPVAEGQKYNSAAHEWVEDTTNTDPTVVKYTCACGATKSEHVHNFELTYDEDNHWYECTNSGCTNPVATKDESAHVWTKDTENSTKTDTVYVCSCGATKTNHTHKWSTKWSTDDDYHWHECSGCGEVADLGIHLDANNSGRCDECKIAMDSDNTLYYLDIYGLDEPSDGVAVDFEVSIDPTDVFGTPSVAWNRVISLSKNTSEGLGTAHTFAGGEKYNTCISVPVNKGDTIDEDFTVTLNGTEIEFYTSKTTVNKVIATYDGNKTVAFAYRDVTSAGYAYIRVCVMYEELDEEHVCTYTDDWVESSAKHYHMCTGCGDIEDAEYHYDDNKSGLCDVCGFDMDYFNKNATSSGGSGSGSHTHSYTSDYIENATQHWKQCLTCGTKIELGNHVDANNTGKCDVCGYVMKSSCTSHTWSTDYVEDAVHHWKACTVCGTKTAIEKHVDANNSGLCDVCGYTMTVPNTGDNGVVYVWTALLAVCAVGLVMTLVYMKKKEAE